MNSTAFGRIAAGPVGSGKTTSCVIELLRRSIEQDPGADGKRYTRHAIVRQTLKQLKDTVLKDCDSWLQGMGGWKVSESTFHLIVASVGETLFDGAATSATLPTSAGEITVLPHHEPLVTTLKVGTITVRTTAAEPKEFNVESGVLEMSGNKATVLL